MGRAARCRGSGAAGQGVCILLTHWELLPVGGGERVKAGAAEQPRAGVYLVQVCAWQQKSLCQIKS